MIFAVLLAVALSLVCICSVSAASVGNAQIQNGNSGSVQKSNMLINKTDNINKSVITHNLTDKDTKSAKNTDINVVDPTQTSADIQKQEAVTAATSTSFTIDQIKDAAARVKAWIETNHKLPNYVTIGTAQVTMPNFLKLLTAGLLEINSGSTASIALKTVSAPATPTEDVKSGNIVKADYLDLATRVNNFINANGKVPNYASTPLGKMRYENMVYAFSRILNFQKVNNYLPNYVSITPWSSMPTPIPARPVYITSDNIDGKTKDTNRINTIVNGLKALGLTAINWGLGPGTHISVLKSSKVPSNALVVDIYGGACAGTIYEMGKSYYKAWVGSRKVFSVWMPPATDITGLAWLPRSPDDNFDPPSFKGLAHPDQYLLNNGYHYIYSGSLNAIITAIYKEATTA